MPTGSHLKKGSSRFNAEDEEKRIVQHNGTDYWSPRETIAYLKGHVPKLRNWKYLTGLVVLNAWQQHCSWLGRPLTNEDLPGTFNRPIAYNLPADVKAIAEAMTSATTRDHAGFVLTDDLAKELDRSRDHVLHLHRLWRKATGKPKDLPKLMPAIDAMGRPTRRSYVTVTFAAWAKRRQQAANLPDEEVILRDEAEVRGVRRSDIRVIIPTTKKRRLLCRDGTVRECLTAKVAEVDKAFAQREAISEHPKAESFKTEISGKAETLLPESLAREQYPHIPSYVYYHYPNKPCPLLGGEVLIAPKTSWPNGYRVGVNLRPRGFLKSQLDRFPRVKSAPERPMQSKVLELLAANGPMTSHEIGKALGADRAACKQLLRKIQKSGATKRERGSVTDPYRYRLLKPVVTTRPPPEPIQPVAPVRQKPGRKRTRETGLMMQACSEQVHLVNARKKKAQAAYAQIKKDFPYNHPTDWKECKKKGREHDERKREDPQYDPANLPEV